MPSKVLPEGSEWNPIRGTVGGIAVPTTEHPHTHGLPPGRHRSRRRGVGLDFGEARDRVSAHGGVLVLRVGSTLALVLQLWGYDLKYQANRPDYANNSERAERQIATTAGVLIFRSDEIA